MGFFASMRRTTPRHTTKPGDDETTIKEVKMVPMEQFPMRCTVNLEIQVGGGVERTVTVDRSITQGEMLEELKAQLGLPQRPTDLYKVSFSDKKNILEPSEEHPIMCQFYYQKRQHPDLRIQLRHTKQLQELQSISIEYEGVQLQFELPVTAFVFQLNTLLKIRYPEEKLVVFIEGKVAKAATLITPEIQLKASQSTSSSPASPRSIESGSSAVMQELVQAIGRDTKNYSCLDCKQPNPVFISANMGIMLCASCALIHTRRFLQEGLFVSRIRPVREYAWSRDCVQILRASGNGSARDFMRLNENSSADSWIKQGGWIYDPEQDAKLIAGIEKQSIVEVQHALQAGANPDGIKNGPNPLHLAVSLGSTPLIELLLRHGADPLLRDSSGHTALFYAYVTLDEDAINRLSACQRFVAFLREHGSSCGYNEEQMLYLWLERVGEKETPSRVALQQLSIPDTYGSFYRLLDAVFMEVGTRARACISKTEPSATESRFPTLKRFVPLLDAVLEELGMRECIAIYGAKWRRRRAGLRLADDRGQPLLQFIDSKQEAALRKISTSFVCDWSSLLEEQIERDRVDALPQTIASPIMKPLSSATKDKKKK